MYRFLFVFVTFMIIRAFSVDSAAENITKANVLKMENISNSFDILATSPPNVLLSEAKKTHKMPTDDEELVPVEESSSNLYSAIPPSSIVGSSNPKDEFEQFENLVNFIEMNMASYGNDVLASCIDETDVKEMIQDASIEYRKSLRRLFILELVLFGITLALCFFTLIFICRKNSTKSHARRGKNNSKKKSLIDNDEISDQYTDITNPSFDQTSMIHHRAGNHSNHEYTVQL